MSEVVPPKYVCLTISIAILGGVVASIPTIKHDLFCCKDPFLLQHQHPPRDPVATAQQDQFKPYNNQGILYADLPAAGVIECRAAGGVPYWLNNAVGQQYLTCHAGNVVGETHGTP